MATILRFIIEGKTIDIYKDHKKECLKLMRGFVKDYSYDPEDFELKKNSMCITPNCVGSYIDYLELSLIGAIEAIRDGEITNKEFKRTVKTYYNNIDDLKTLLKGFKGIPREYNDTKFEGHWIEV